jgi:hypothetical protein
MVLSLVALVLVIAFIIWLIAKVAGNKFPAWVEGTAFFVLVVCLVLLVLGVELTVGT